MSFAEQLQLLQAAQGDPAKLALATVDLKYPDLSEGERTALKEALETAAIPHWCDEDILGALLDIPPAQSAARFDRLRNLRVVEPFPARGPKAVNVHEATRLALRKGLISGSRERFCALSSRAAARFQHDPTTAGKIERVYHLLGTNAQRGADELEKLTRQWAGRACAEEFYALAAAVKELRDSPGLAGRAGVWSLLAIVWARWLHGEVAQLEGDAKAVLRLAREAKDSSAEGEAQALLGDVFEAQGKLAGAQTAYAEFLAISRRLTAQDPTNADWQRDLAVAQGLVGDVLQARGRLLEAQAAYGESLAISGRLAAQDPDNAGWQRDLALAQARVGTVLQEQDKLEEAHSVYEEYLKISRRLAEHDPDSSGWQLDLAVAHSRMGDVSQAQGKLEEAQAAFGEYQAITRRLTERDPHNGVWQRELAVAHGKVGDVLQAGGKLAEAREALEAALAISRRLAAQDPKNADWQRDVAVACLRLARLEARADRQTAALPHYEEASHIFSELVVQAPGFARWVNDKELVEAELAAYRSKVNAA